MCKHIYNSENLYPKGTPFTYLIGWSEFNKFYYGVKYSKKGHPNDLWTTYFTSSNSVKNFRIKNGEPDIIKIDYIFDNIFEAKFYEYEYIKNNKLIYDNDWLNLGNSGEFFCGNKESLKEQSKRFIGTIWINNGIINKRIFPDDFQNYSDIWKFGQIVSFSEESKRKMKKPKSNEFRENLSNYQKGTIWINNGNINKKIKPEELQNYLLSIWTKGKLPQSILNNVISRKNNLSSNNKKITIHNFKIQLAVFPEEAKLLYSFGFLKGKKSN